MARSVSDLVLVRDDFAAVPAMVAEGRQILRNIQRVARLFITKAVFTAVVGLAVAIPTGTFPLLPRQFTIASTVTIGIPAFLLALAPSSGPWRPDSRPTGREELPVPAPSGLDSHAGAVVADLAHGAIGVRHARRRRRERRECLMTRPSAVGVKTARPSCERGARTRSPRAALRGLTWS